IVAAPLLDSSSGCACTAISRNCSANPGSSRRSTCAPTHGGEARGADNHSRRGIMSYDEANGGPPVTEGATVDSTALDERYGRRPGGRKRARVLLVVAGV